MFKTSSLILAATLAAHSRPVSFAPETRPGSEGSPIIQVRFAQDHPGRGLLEMEPSLPEGAARLEDAMVALRTRRHGGPACKEQSLQHLSQMAMSRSPVTSLAVAMLGHEMGPEGLAQLNQLYDSKAIVEPHAGETLLGIAQPDLSLFEAAVLVVRDNLGSEVRFDPRALDLSDRVLPVNESAYLSEPDSVVAQRKALFQRLSLDTGSVFPRLDRCTGIFAPPPSKITDGCPAEPQLLVAFALPSEKPETGHRAVRYLELSYNPSGFVIHTYEMQFSRSAGDWTLVKIIPLLVVE